MENTKKLTGKELINVGIYTAMTLVIFFVVGLLTALPVVYPFLFLIWPIVCGIPMMLYYTKITTTPFWRWPPCPGPNMPGWPAARPWPGGRPPGCGVTDMFGFNTPPSESHNMVSLSTLYKPCEVSLTY